MTTQKRDVDKPFLGQLHIEENVSYVLKDKDGNVKNLFQTNSLGTILLKLFRKLIKEPVVPNGSVKTGWLNKLAAYGLRIPGLTGSWVSELNLSNLVTNAGFAGVASRLGGSGAEAAFTYIAVGTGTTAAAVTDTTLVTETAVSGLSRVAGSLSRVTTTITNDTAQVTTTFTVTGTVAVTESGVLNAASVGTLLSRQVFSAINVVNGDSLTMTWKHKFS